MIESLSFCQKNKGLEIYAFVIMSNHLHLLIRSKSEHLSETIKEFKSFTAKEFLKVIDSEIESRRKWMLKQFEFAAQSHCRKSKDQVWTHENHAEIIYTNKFIEQKIKYIYDNTIRAGLVKDACDYIYSSASDFCNLKIEYVHRSVEGVRKTSTLR